MPELPEVETIVRELRQGGIIGRRIAAVDVYWARTIATSAPNIFAKRIVGQGILEVSRRGKWIVLTLSQDSLLVHLRMTGKFLLSDVSSIPSLHERVRLELDDGRCLSYEDQRKFGKWHLLRSPTDHLNSLGIEPLSDTFTWKALQNVLDGRSQAIKPFLLNQAFIAGLGNIYVDEALWQAKLHPLRRTNDLQVREIRALREAIVDVLNRGVEHRGTSLGTGLSNYFSVSGERGRNQTKLNVFRRENQACPRCHTKIVKIVVVQRGTHFCPTCQRPPSAPA